MAASRKPAGQSNKSKKPLKKKNDTETPKVEDIETEEIVQVDSEADSTNDNIDTPKDNDEDENDDYDEEEDEDYDPEAKPISTNQGDEQEEDEDDDDDGDEKIPDFSAIESSTSQVRTRNQKLQEKHVEQSKFIGRFEVDSSGLVKDPSYNLDVDEIFKEMKTSNTKDWQKAVEESSKESKQPEQGQDGVSTVSSEPLGPKKIKIETSYAFAGKLITETKLVDEDSAEAKAYLNSTSVLTAQDKNEKGVRSFVPVIRKLPKSDQEVELRIKLKRPSLIDKFLSTHGNKKMKLSTLEKSRLDWASFVDKRKIGDELKIHNKAGYLDKQDFLGRLQDKRDTEYQKAKEEERQRQWLKQQK
ncbi:bucentaur or craniofacial development-domain-containing protein [Scheffersomyces xylosifermentans]|uniref:bucentaur or craniofacial development-domain-containing protein n=1 Tax=Scheffersomyces xylosifermentans TaxID=1304137 RepID=UPI00315D113B